MATRLPLPVSPWLFPLSLRLLHLCCVASASLLLMAFCTPELWFAGFLSPLLSLRVASLCCASCFWCCFCSGFSTGFNHHLTMPGFLLHLHRPGPTPPASLSIALALRYIMASPSHHRHWIPSPALLSTHGFTYLRLLLRLLISVLHRRRVFHFICAFSAI